MFEKRIFETDNGYGYEILENGIAIIVQHFAPDVQGAISMTEAEANANADIVLARVQSNG